MTNTLELDLGIWLILQLARVPLLGGATRVLKACRFDIARSPYDTIGTEALPLEIRIFNWIDATLSPVLTGSLATCELAV